MIRPFHQAVFSALSKALKKQPAQLALADTQKTVGGLSQIPAFTRSR